MITTINNFRQINENNNSDISKVATLFNNLFSLRQAAHDIHLTKSIYSEHIALDDFYTGLLDLIDELFETYQGQYGLLSDYTTEIVGLDESDKIKLLETYTTQIKQTCVSVFTDSHLLNICDEIFALCYRTLYKLKFLK